MALTLSPAIEQRIQRETDRGPYTAPDDLLNHALDLLEAKAEVDWLSRNRDAINADLDISFAEADRGDSYSPEELRFFSPRAEPLRAA
jgi:Arc/MetJ-type ribon-helix-helix transcriptional regulator